MTRAKFLRVNPYFYRFEDHERPNPGPSFFRGALAGLVIEAIILGLILVGWRLFR